MAVATILLGTGGRLAGLETPQEILHPRFCFPLWHGWVLSWKNSHGSSAHRRRGCQGDHQYLVPCRGWRITWPRRPAPQNWLGWLCDTRASGHAAKGVDYGCPAAASFNPWIIPLARRPSGQRTGRTLALIIAMAAGAVKPSHARGTTGPATLRHADGYCSLTGGRTRQGIGTGVTGSAYEAFI